MSDCSALGAHSLIAVQGGSAPRTFSSSSELIPAEFEEIGSIYEWSGMQAGVGEIGVSADANRIKSRTVMGAIKVMASPQELHRWLPRAMWGTVTSGTEYTSGNLPSNYGFDVLVLRENGVHKYSNCLVSKLVVSSNASNGGDTSEMVMLDIMIVGTEETIEGLSWPSPGPQYADTLSQSPYMHYESQFDTNAETIPLERWALEIDNRLRPVRNQSIDTMKWRTQGRRVSFDAVGAFTTSSIAEALDKINTPGDCTLLLSHSLGALSCTFTLSNARNMRWRTPNIPGRGHIPLAFTLVPGNTVGTSELSVSNIHTL